MLNQNKNTSLDNTFNYVHTTPETKFDILTCSKI